MKTLLRLKHWQIFLISWGPHATFLFFLFVRPYIFQGHFQLWLFSFLLGTANAFIWIWTIIAELEKRAPQMNVRFLKIAFWIPCIFIWSFTALALYDLNIRKLKTINFQVELIIFASLGVLSVLCILYGLIFIGRLIRAVELGRPALFKEHLLESILMLIPPLGLWFIQPKLNQIVTGQENVVADS